MARIILKNPGQSVADFSVNGHLITVAGITIDCIERQQDAAVTVDIREQGGEISEFPPNQDGGAFVAHIYIPAKVYEETAATASGEDEDGGGGALVAQPLDPNAITVTLWPFFG